MDLQHLRLLMVQNTEPYRDGMENGTLNAEQLIILEGLTTWRFQLQEVGVLGCVSDTAYDEVLETGVRVRGSGLSEINESIFRRLADFCPTHLIINTPIPSLFQWAAHQQVRCVGMFQENLAESSLKQRWGNYQLSKALNHSNVDWVGGFGLNGCESLANIGVLRNKLIPWSWPPSNRVETFEPKQLRSRPDPLHLIYVGPIFSIKGIGDLLISIAQLKVQGWNVHLKLVGQGDIQRFKQYAKRLQLNQIEFVENIPNHALVHLIRQADIFVMPSRHESLENANTILNYCLQAHTPIVASDHPMFAGSLSHGVNAMIFPAGNARAMSQCISYLLNHPETYVKLSAANQTAWQSLQLPVHWISLLDHWLQETDATRQWLQQHALKSPFYQHQPILQQLQPSF
ncbi:MAG: glycosyltransferase [Cyanobacteria bacterium P01_H01_bin.105]